MSEMSKRDLKRKRVAEHNARFEAYQKLSDEEKTRIAIRKGVEAGIAQVKKDLADLMQGVK